MDISAVSLERKARDSSAESTDTTYDNEEQAGWSTMTSGLSESDLIVQSEDYEDSRGQGTGLWGVGNERRRAAGDLGGYKRRGGEKGSQQP